MSRGGGSQPHLNFGWGGGGVEHLSITCVYIVSSGANYVSCTHKKLFEAL